jgi:hypothetical protein
MSVRTEEVSEQPKPGSHNSLGPPEEKHVKAKQETEDRNRNQKEYYHPNREVSEFGGVMHQRTEQLTVPAVYTIAPTRLCPTILGPRMGEMGYLERTICSRMKFRDIITG